MRIIPIECVKEGSFLAKTIFDNDGRILLREGSQLSPAILRRIRMMKIYSLYIIDEYSNKEIEDVIKPELRQKSVKLVRDTFYNIEKVTNNKTSANNNASIKQRESYFSAISSLASELMDEILSKKNVLINLVDIKSMDNYTYQHSVNVAVLSLILGIQLKLNKYELYDLCIGALIHDIGKVLIPKDLLLKEGPLTEEEFIQVRDHTTKGYEYLRTVLEITGPARIVALQHHERYDGKGYPDKKRGDEISKLARIVSIADVYDALTSDRPYRRAMSPNDAVEYILASGSSQFDYELVKAFASAVIPYPEGTIVRLSNGDCAVVEEVFQNYPLRPVVKVVKSEDKSRENLLTNLTSSLDIVILGHEYNV
jgi:HD-GYP domain-containing protein (c-di-GMP phosphodiesterase class II)